MRVIEVNPFAFCERLYTIEVKKENPLFCRNLWCFVQLRQNVVICCPAARSWNYVIPNEVGIITCHSFTRCSLLTTIKIPDGVISIKQCAFVGCTNLMRIRLPLNVLAIEVDIFHGCICLGKLLFLKKWKSCTINYLED